MLIKMELFQENQDVNNVLLVRGRRLNNNHLWPGEKTLEL